MEVNDKNIGYVKHRFMPVKSKLLNKSSKTEEKFEQMLIDANIYFTREKCNFRIGTRWCYYDFYIPYWRLYIELDGESHNSPEQRCVDKQKDRIIKNKKQYTCRIKNEYVLNKMDKVDYEILTELLFNYVLGGNNGINKKNWKYEKVKASFESNLEYNHRQSVEDFTANNESVDFKDDTPITLYNNLTGMYYTFENIIDATLKTGLKAKYIWELCFSEYKRIGNRRTYVAAFSLDECERRVAIVYD